MKSALPGETLGNGMGFDRVSPRKNLYLLFLNLFLKNRSVEMKLLGFVLITKRVSQEKPLGSKNFVDAVRI